MPYFSRLHHAARYYVAGVVVLGLAVLLWSLFVLITGPAPDHSFLAIIFLTLLTGSVTVRLPATTATISVSETFVFLSVLLYGPHAGTLVVALDVLTISLGLLRRKPQPLHRIIFNVAAPSLSVWISGHLFYYLANLPAGLTLSPHAVDLGSAHTFLLPLLAFTVLHYILNSWLVAFAIALESNTRATLVWKQNLIAVALNYFAGASLATLVAAFTLSYSLWALAILIPPVALSYFTSRTASFRIEEARRHIEQLHTLYLSTIETLAMAIDAGDQVTHGHIRRVQAAALALAAEMQVRDDNVLKALQAAALLHDIGKLAVPEHILNKPGPLTPGEFDTMKRHAPKGADILSAIDFPYPVTPIVRHHHENWDGTGYPDGLSGTDIPIGARILAVVDCYDALTSDRPYRLRLPKSKALAILADRRGTMYDPLVVDAFLRIVDQVPDASDPPVSRPTHTNESELLNPQERAVLTGFGDHETTDDILDFFDVAGALLGRVTLEDAAMVLTRRLLRLVDADASVLYCLDELSDRLVPSHVTGAIPQPLTSIPNGERLSGWVAANRRTVVNGDPALDFAAPSPSRTRLLSALSTPLLAGQRVVGVLTLFSVAPQAYSEDDRRTLETLSPLIGSVVDGAVRYQRTEQQMRDSVTGLPNERRFARLLHSPLAGSGVSQRAVSLLMIDVVPGSLAESQTQLREAVLELAHHVRRHLRNTDVLFRCDNGSFVVVLHDTTRENAEIIADRVRRSAGSPSAPRLRFSVTVLVPPSESAGVASMMDTVMRRLDNVPSSLSDFPAVH